MRYSFLLITTILFVGGCTDPGTSGFTAQRCSMRTGMGCVSFNLDSGGLSVALLNMNAFDITDIEVRFEGEGCAGTATGPYSLKDDEEGAYILSDCADLLHYEGDIIATYRNSRGEDGISTGKVVVSAAP